MKYLKHSQRVASKYDFNPRVGDFWEGGKRKNDKRDQLR